MRNRAVTAGMQRLRKARLPGPIRRMPWAEKAACRGRDLATDLWADDANPARAVAARAACAACPVQAACLAHALAYDEPWGIWGGHTTRERVAPRLGIPVPRVGTTTALPYVGAHGPRPTEVPAARRHRATLKPGHPGAAWRSASGAPAPR